MRAARLITMVLLLQSRPGMTGAELARRLEVSERTVARDVLALSEAGVPVYADRGRTGGYRLVGGYRTRLTGLGRTEAEALFLSGVPSALREMGLADAASAARLKVSAALLPELRDAAAGAAQRFHLDAPAWFHEAEPPALLPAIAHALWHNRRLTTRYQRGNTEAERELEPYGLVLKAGVWYLAARVADGDGEGAGGGPGAGGTGAPGSGPAAGAVRVADGGGEGTGTGSGQGGTGAGSGAAAGAARVADGSAEGTGAGPGAGVSGRREFRVYRVDRFTAVASGEERFQRSEAFDLPAFWEERAVEFARSILRDRVEVRLTPDGARQLPYVTDQLAAREALAAAGDPDEQGRITVTLPVETVDVAYSQLLGLGPEAEVLAPAALRERFARAAREMAARYGAR
ncbi:helix-turn-helix transcriptional regulator [Streptomyces varsoviensis]|uniref:helix-turn-helix transcriptional regulator n=1 Tax=Streptomyces varsoviensis TaxID=67373 RepID=UPI0004C7D2BC|nr:WYL domain-containing protein [Streptomyces varsoviensis]